MPINLIHETVTPDQLTRYARLIYDRTGIVISPQKRTLLSNRLRRRLRETGIEGYEAYYKHLSKLRDADPEWDAFLQEITTHETYLFRDETHWKWFREQFVAEVAEAARRGQRQRTLRILSAACSTGDEPFTIAACIAACMPNLSQWKIDVLGTDIGAGALEEAKAATFNERAMRLVPDDYRKRFFIKSPTATLWTAKPTLMSLVRFRQHNLMAALSERPFDLVFVKNVLIYFDKPSKQKVLDHLRKAIAPGGLLVAGAAEGVSDLLNDFQRLEPWLYRKA
ncbi:MAG: histidine kinase [Planctomycetota bacterium]|nr:MAG: histidine kinase [Planctomycetota bacterium]